MGGAAQVAADQSRFGGTWSSFVNTTTSYSSWTGDRGSNVFAADKGKGHQVYSPTTIGIDYLQPGALKVETRARGGYVYPIKERRGRAGPMKARSIRRSQSTRPSWTSTACGRNLASP